MNVHNFTVCDLIRQEDNGKFLLIGVYTNGIVFAQLPVQINLSFWMLIEHERAGKTRFSIRGSMPETDAHMFEMQGELDILNPEDWTPLGMTAPIMIGQPGNLVIEARLSDGDWFPLRTLRVLRGPIPSRFGL